MHAQSTRASKGVIIQEPKEPSCEPPRKKLQTPVETSTDTPKTARAMKETTSTPIATPATTTEQHVPTTINIEIPQEPLIEQAVPMVQTPPASDEVEIIEVTNTNTEVENPVADQEIPTVAVVEETPEAVNTNSDAEMMRVIDETMQVMEDIEEDAEEDVANEEMSEEETESQRDTSAKDSTSGAISEQEFTAMKKSNPIAALKFLMSLSSSSTNIANSASTTSLNSINQESTEGLLRQLKAKVLEDDFLAMIEQNSTENFALKEILNKLQKLEPSPELLIFIVEFGPLLDNLSYNLRKRATVAQQKDREVKLHEEKLNALKTSQDAFSNLDTQVAKDEKELADCESKIQQYTDEIKLLQSKLAGVERQKQQVQERMGIPMSKMKAKATEAIEHFDAAQQHQASITQFDKELSILESTISANIAVLDRLKASLQNLS